ncbi:MAG: nucleoside deaminase [candidate division Zixibacteria bacterium]|nr:nucleoside deaminase [candidate division Zixibacteria bacterium]
MQPDQYEDYMRLAIDQAGEAFEADEVPIGAVVVHHNKVIGRGYNQTERLKDATAHAEMIALSAAFNHIGDWRLEDCYLFSTVEPCTMCAGAAVLSRIKRIVYGASDPKFGACGSIFNVPTEKKLNHRIEVVSGVLSEEISDMMKQFFKQIRMQKDRIN